MSIRSPWVAGTFYPSDPNRLMASIKDSFMHKLGPMKIPERGLNIRDSISIVCPHAGYMYSGPVAAHGYFHLASEADPESIIIIGPSHTGIGSPIAIMNKGFWRTPLGKVSIDEELSNAILKEAGFIDVDETAHSREHSIEVQLPFLQYIYGSDFSFVPICMSFQDLESSRELGDAIGKACEGKEVLIIASTDLSHYEDQATANRKDKLAIEAILNLNEVQLQERVYKNRITMCGFGPVSAAIVASKHMGARYAELFSYHTSGDISGDYSAVVGYASIRISK